MDNILTLKEIASSLREEKAKASDRQAWTPTVWVYAPDLEALIKELYPMKPMHRFAYVMNYTSWSGPSPQCEIERLYDAMKEPLEEGDIVDNAYETNYIPRPKHREVDSDMGEINIEKYMDRHSRPFDEVRVLEREGLSQTALIDIGVNANFTDGTNVAEQHARIYSLCASAEANRQPFRVIGCYKLSCDEAHDGIRFFVILKDYDDPIFPGIWNLIKNNNIVNLFLNFISDYVLGTHSFGNGAVRDMGITQADLGDGNEEVIVIQDQTPNIYYHE